MLIEILLALACGIFFGTITGLLPGIHINLVGAILVTLSLGILSSINPVYLAVFVVAMAITHTLVDFIPSVFLGCPSEGTELSILPGHELLQEGKGYEAVMLSVYGGLLGIFILVITTFPLLKFVEQGYNFVKTFIPFILIGILIFMIFSEKKKFSALLVVILTGILGLSVLNLELKEPLLPMLTGLFGASSIILSIKTKMSIPNQEITKPKPKLIKPFFATIISSPLCGFLPGLGSSQAAIIGNTIIKSDKKGFLTLLGSTNTLVMAFSFVSLYTINKIRTGAAATIDNLLGGFNINLLFLLLSVCVLSGIIAFFLVSVISKKIIKVIEKINYSKLSIVTLIFVSFIVLIFSGVIGFLVFIISTFTGIYCILSNVKRTSMMACLIIPTIAIYLF